MRIVSFGNLYLDYYIKNGCVEGVSGGKTNANILANLSNHYECFFIGSCGTDSIGDIIIKDLNDLGIKNKIKRVDKQSKAYFIDNNTYSTECPFCNREVGYHGEILTESEVIPEILESDYLVIDNFHVLTTKVLKSTTNKAFLDIGYDYDIRYRSLDELTDIIANRFEIINMNNKVFRTFKNKFMLDELDIYELFKPKLLIITKGKKGCTIVLNGEVIEKEIENPEKEVDVSGAGDAFFSEFIATYLENEELDEKLISKTYIKANLKSRLIVRNMGARTHLKPLYKIKNYKNCVCEYLIVD